MRLEKRYFFITLLITFSLIFFYLPNQKALADIGPPQLEIRTPAGNIRNSTVILHGMAYDENGIQKVTVNGANASGTRTTVHYFWVKYLNLSVGENVIEIVAYDDSINHNSVSKNITLFYQPDSYQGPTVKLIPVSSLPSNNATIKCILNPNGHQTSIYLSYAGRNCAHAPFNSGRGGFPTFNGTEDIIFNYTFSRDEELSVGTTIAYIFQVSNREGFAYSKVGYFNVTDPVDLPTTQDVTPPQLHFWPSNVTVPSSSIVINGMAFDESGISNVTVLNQTATGYFHEEWAFWQMKVNLTEGENEIFITAYDNSTYHNSRTRKTTVTYSPSNYNGPTIQPLPVLNPTISNATLRCRINPNGVDYTGVYLCWSLSSFENAPFQHGRSCGRNYSGTEDIVVSYPIWKEGINVGDTISYIFHVENGEGWNSTEIITFTVIDQNVHLGDIKIRGNETLIIENCDFYQRGNIVVNETGSLILRNATLILDQPSSHQFEISFHNNSYFESYNSIIINSNSSDGGYYIFMYDEAVANISNSRFKYPGTLLDVRGANVSVIVSNSHLDYINVTGNSNVEVINSQANVHIWSGSPSVIIHNCQNIDSVLMAFHDASIANLTLEPGYYGAWDFQNNETVIDSGISLRIYNSSINHWILYMFGQSKIMIQNSTLSSIYCKENSTINVKDSSLGFISSSGNSHIEIVNSSVSGQFEVKDYSKIYLGWYLDVLVFNDEVLQDGAIVRAFHSEDFSLCDKGSTDSNGNLRLILWGKKINSTGIYYYGDYILAANFGKRIGEESIKMDDNKKIIISLHKQQTRQTINSQGKDQPNGEIQTYVFSVCGQDYQLISPTNADFWNINITITSELLNQSVHIAIYEAIGDYPYNYTEQINAPKASGKGTVTLSAILDPQKNYEIWVRDAYAKPFIGKIKEFWYSVAMNSTYKLYVGWNLIGIPLNIKKQSIEVIFDENIQNVISIYGFNNEFKNHSYWFSGNLSTLMQFECGYGYWVLVNSNFTLMTTGTRDNPPPLFEGWNLICSTNTNPVSIKEFLKEELFQVRYILGFDNKAKKYLHWINGLLDELQTLKSLQPERGYWVYVQLD